MKIVLHFAVISILASCNQGARRPANFALVTGASDDLVRLSEQVLEDVESEGFTDKTCHAYLTRLESQLDHIDVRQHRRSVLVANGAKIADASWKIRTTLHGKLPSLPRECALQLQANFRQLRFIEDYVQELSSDVTHQTPNEIAFTQQPVPMKEHPPFYVTRLAIPGAVFEDGDVFVTRGVSFLSSMIARMGVRPSQFSHIVFLHENPTTKKMETIESYVGVGVQFYDMDFALKNENARILWLRSKDRALAKRASSMIGPLVRDRIAKGQTIRYDYELNFDDPATMSCAEVSQVAFKLASQGEIKIPFYPNEIAGATPLVSRLRIPPGPTFEPGDLELDPRFEIVGEFQDLRLTRDSRQKDTIMSEMFRWMDAEGYVLHESMNSRLARGPIHKIRRTPLWPLVQKMLKLSDFSKEIPSNMLGAVTLINQISEVLLEELKKQDIAFEQEHGIPMPPVVMARALEEWRKKDLALYQNRATRSESKIHKFLRPRG